VDTPTTHIFRASLNGKLYRDIELDSSQSLHDLAEAIVQAFDFDLDHAFGFYSKLTGHYHDSPVKYELFADLDDGESDAGSVMNTTIAEAFPDVKSQMLFLFDYGDQWEFKVRVTGMGKLDPKAEYPKILKSVGKALPQYPDLEE
jgi:hypothetical protein